MADLFGNLAYVALCLAIPIGWGWFVNWGFNRWKDRDRDDPEASTYIDYQI